MNKNARGFHQIIILPIDSIKEGKHQSSRPKGLILDEVYEEVNETTSTDDERSRRNVAARNAIHVNELDGQLCEISISHDGDFATAIAIVPLMASEPTHGHFHSQPSPKEQAPDDASQWSTLHATSSASEILAVSYEQCLFSSSLAHMVLSIPKAGSRILLTEDCETTLSTGSHSFVIKNRERKCENTGCSRGTRSHQQGQRICMSLEQTHMDAVQHYLKRLGMSTYWMCESIACGSSLGSWVVTFLLRQTHYTKTKCIVFPHVAHMSTKSMFFKRSPAAPPAI